MSTAIEVLQRLLDDRALFEFSDEEVKTIDIAIDALHALKPFAAIADHIDRYTEACGRPFYAERLYTWHLLPNEGEVTLSLADCHRAKELLK